MGLDFASFHNNAQRH